MWKAKSMTTTLLAPCVDQHAYLHTCTQKICTHTCADSRIWTCMRTPRHATPRHATPRHATPCHATPRHATPRSPRHGTQGNERLAQRRRCSRVQQVNSVPCAWIHPHVHPRHACSTNISFAHNAHAHVHAHTNVRANAHMHTYVSTRTNRRAHAHTRTNGLYRYGLYSYGLYSYGRYSCGRYSYGPGSLDARVQHLETLAEQQGAVLEYVPIQLWPM